MLPVIVHLMCPITHMLFRAVFTIGPGGCCYLPLTGEKSEYLREEATWPRPHSKFITVQGAQVCLTPNPFSNVLTPARHGESRVEDTGYFWLRTGDSAVSLTQWACCWPVPGLL